MALPTDPLNEVNLNTVLATHVSENQINSKSKWSNNIQTMNNNSKCIDLLFQELNSFVQTESSEKIGRDHISNTISELYSRLIQMHSVTYIPILIKSHLLIIGKYISEGQYTCASKEILHLYNSSNLYAAHNLGEILLSDFYISNHFYLSTLKILTIQVILKTKSLNTYEPVLLKMFAYDDRYILSDPKLKIHLVNKLLLNLYSISTQNKSLFGLKFLQYLSQFNVKLESYIKNMDKLMFQKQIVAYYRKQQNDSMLLNIFYLKYSQYCQSLDKIMLSDLTKGKQRLHYQFQNPESFLNLVTNEHTPCHLNIEDIEDVTMKCILFLNDNSFKISDKIKVIYKVWTILHMENTIFGVNQKKLFDQSLATINSGIKSIGASMLDTFTILKDICITNNQMQRFLNLTNVMFNHCITSKDIHSVQFAIEVDVKSVLLSHNKIQVGYANILKKLHKFLQCFTDVVSKYNAFKQYYNIFIIFDITTLTDLFAYLDLCKSMMQRWISKVFNNDKSCMSEIMTAFFIEEANNENDDNKKWNPLTHMIQSNITDTFNSKISTDTIQNKYHFLTKYEVPIKTIYLTNMEIIKHSSKNIPRLVDYYTKRWINNPNMTEPISSMELSFLKRLFNHLLLINFDRMMIQLTDALKADDRYFKRLSIHITNVSLQAFVKLQYFDKIDDLKGKVLRIIPDFKTADIKSLIIFLNIILTICSGRDDRQLFNQIFSDENLKKRKELFSISNTHKLPMETYLHVILFNTRLHITASNLHSVNDDLISAVIEGKRSLKLSLSLLKSKGLLGQDMKSVLIKNLTQTYSILLKLSTQMGVSRDAIYYATELSKFITGISEPSVVFSCLHELFVHYKSTGQNSFMTTTLQKVNETFNHLNSQEDIHDLVSFMLDNGENEKLVKSIELIFGVSISDTKLLQYCELQIGRVLNSLNNYPTSFVKMNQINSINQQYNRISKQLEIDQLFKNIHDSPLSIPSIKHNPKEKDITNRIFDNIDYSNGSPRPSNMTPKSKHMRQKFDKFAAINNLNLILKNIEKASIPTLDYVSLSRFAYIYAECASLLANLTSTFEVNVLYGQYLLDIKRSIPLQYDRLLSCVDKNIYQEFTLLKFREVSDLEINSCFTANPQISSITSTGDYRFNTITIDICPITGNLMLTRCDSLTGETKFLRIPLNSLSLRDIETGHLPFSKAMEELNNIISQSNLSVSREVTSMIHTSDGRKDWWKTRYNLDKQLEELLTAVEKTWFGGFSGFFSNTEVNRKNFEEFQNSFTNTLHQNLPSRKQVGSPEKFLIIEDWILELFLQIDPSSKNFLTMVEDLIYFVLDILTYHGEENAYDEVEISVLHFEIEEAIKKYHTMSRANETKRFMHTFLIVGSRCHAFPWESLSFMKYLSVTRMPSMSLLRDLLSKNNFDTQLDIDIGSRISMILNPNGDLLKTEDRFLSAFSNIMSNCINSKLLVNERPTQEDFLKMLQTSNLFIFIGHGGGDQFARNKDITTFPNISPSLLLGCSSAAMKSSGNLEPTGVVYSHLLGGSNMVLGNLWDVTDKDIDKFTMSLLEKIGLVSDITTESRENMGICEATNLSRNLCNLKFLNGAAPVLYGLPAYFSNHGIRQ